MILALFRDFSVIFFQVLRHFFHQKSANFLQNNQVWIQLKFSSNSRKKVRHGVRHGMTRFLFLMYDKSFVVFKISGY